MKKKIDYTNDQIQSMIGKVDIKTTGKPFKSGNEHNTVLGIVTHPILGCPAFTFVEDDSFVECCRCVVVEK